MKTKSVLTLTDSYKLSHSSQYPSNMLSMYDYMASRGGMYDEIIFVGLQYYLKEYLMTPVTLQEIERTKVIAESHGTPFDYDGWLHILNNHGGIIPVAISAIPEGKLIPVKTIQLSVESTDPRVPWTPGFIEPLLMMTYYPTMVASKSYHIKQMLLKYGSPAWADFALHHFGARACHSPESAAISGYAHASQFLGTDVFSSLFLMEDYYNQPAGVAASYSVWASEHSTITSNCSGTTSTERLAEEEDFVYRMLIMNPDRPIMSFVADSTDVYAFTNFCTSIDSRIRSLIESRPHQKLVLRPDSGDPIEVLEGMLSIMIRNNIVEVPTASGKTLFRDFGLLWGDGITVDGIEGILQVFTTLYSSTHPKMAAENFIFGMGGGLATVDMHRDTSKYAVKCSSIVVDNGEFVFNDDPTEVSVWKQNLQCVDVYKNPITDPGKASLKGKVTSYFDTEARTYIIGIKGREPNMHCVNSLVETYRDGKLLVDYSMSEVRAASC